MDKAAVFELFAENSSDAIIVTSIELHAPGPSIEYVNPAFTQMTGYEAREVIGKTPRILQGPRTDRDWLDAMRVSLAHGLPFVGEAVNYRKDGTEYLVEWQIRPARDKDGVIDRWVSIQKDITEPRKLKDNIVARDQHLKFIIESASDYAIFVTDPEDKITDWWSGAAAVYGWSAEEAVGRGSALTFTVEDRDAGVPLEEARRARVYGITPNVRWHLHADGHLVFIEGSVRALRDPDGKLLGFLKIGQDVTPRKLAERRLRDSEARLARAVSAAKMSTWEWDTARGTLHFSAGTEALFGQPEGSLVSIDAMLQAVHPDHRLATRVAVERAVGEDEGSQFTVQFKVALPGGATRWLLVTGKAERNAEEAAPRLAAITQDITERHEAEARIGYLARHDSLTGLANRNLLEEELAGAFLRSDGGIGFAVLALDLDDFKDVNDAFGHAGGDAVLRAAANRLRAAVRRIDVVARLGGDEFVIIQPQVFRPVDAETLAIRLTAELGQPYEIDGHLVSIGVSIGIALAPQDGTDVAAVLRSADLALYAAKQQTGGSYRFFEPEIQARAEVRRKLGADLRQAIVRNEFELHYQPLVALAGQEIVAFEALVRWRHPTRGLVAPADFISVAEEIGLIDPIGAWVLATACADAARWPAPLRVAVNLSARQFAGGGLPEVVSRALAEAGLAPHRLELEITESLLLQDAKETLATLHRLRAQGVLISMDDFGTGYSSLSYFAKFPFDKMKIDRSFVAASHEKHGAAIIRAAADLCRSFGIAVVAEGIETAEQLHRVISLGCVEGQGFLFAPPCPAADIDRLLSDWTPAGVTA